MQRDSVKMAVISRKAGLYKVHLGGRTGRLVRIEERGNAPSYFTQYTVGKFNRQKNIFKIRLATYTQYYNSQLTIIKVETIIT